MNQHYDCEAEGSNNFPSVYQNEYQILRGEENSKVEYIQSLSTAISTNAEVISKTIDLASQITDVYAESQRLNAQVEITRERNKLEIARITAKFLTTKQLIEETFRERHLALNASYEVLQKGMNDNNVDLILAAMREIGAVVISSPLNDLKEFAKAFNDKSQPLLDF